MNTLLIAYLGIGLLSNIIGPVASKINKEFLHDDFLMAGYALAQPDVYEKKKRKVFSFNFFFRLLVTLFYPVFYFIVILDYFRLKRSAETD